MIAGSTSRLAERAFASAGLLSVLLPLGLLGLLLAAALAAALPRLSVGFLLSPLSRDPAQAGIYTAALGSALLVGLTAAIAVPLGVGAAVYLEEYRRQGRFARLIELNIASLAGVPSIIYGLLGLEIFVRVLGLGRSLLAGAATLALLILPLIVVSSREALRTVPDSLREGAYALGATRLQVVRGVVLPVALPGILTGAVLAVSRALGETAPLLVLGAVAYAAAPDGLMSPLAALPVQLFHWSARPQAGFAADAAAGIVVLVTILVAANGAAIVARDRATRGQR